MRRKRLMQTKYDKFLTYPPPASIWTETQTSEARSHGSPQHEGQGHYQVKPQLQVMDSITQVRLAAPRYKLLTLLELLTLLILVTQPYTAVLQKGYYVYRYDIATYIYGLPSKSKKVGWVTWWLEILDTPYTVITIKAPTVPKLEK